MIRKFEWLFIVLLCCLQAGCFLTILGQAIPQYEPAKYTGLQNQTVGVMVWADRAIRVDFPTVQMDVAGAVQKRLMELVTPKDTPKDLTGTKFPVLPQSIIRYQQDHPEIDGLPITSVAPRLGVSRLIYLEIEQLATRSNQSVELYRGSVVATMKVVEVTDGKATVAYTENNVSALFPKKVPAEGIPGAEDYRIYLGAVDEFSKQVVNRLVEHEVEK